ncbi:unnamed protein product [Spirodela intermedia]|uniref:Remorin C-terminal domain-containing protein n=1 Tax=Spirodela intermedia TaxID=51605 RepID=A0A7I8IMU6_SPIIN|nr:unnamed protein product [Spirodela intermedia]CAA6659284.1 unnamed protein product [Spirodela intermedia]
MDLQAPKYLQSLAVFPSAEGESAFYGGENPFADAFPDPLCKLNLKETSDFVRAFPAAAAQRRRESSTGRRLEAPPTPGRPVFGFSHGNLSRKSVPSKWDDAEKWLISSSSCHASPAHAPKPCIANPPKAATKPAEALFHRVPEEAARRPAAPPSFPLEDTLKDKFTDNVEPIFPGLQCSEPAGEVFLFRNSIREPATRVGGAATAAQHRDVGTEMTPLGSSTTSRCHTPFKTSSPARHNTPADRSGPLAPPASSGVDISEIKECHFANLVLGAPFDLMVSNWSSREEEEEEISKSLRHCEVGGAGRKSMAELKASAWEDEEKSKICVRYQREEAKIQAWVNLQSAKAEAESRKLEVKIQKMRSNLEEKLMKKMAVVYRKAEEWRAAAQLQHSQETLKTTEQAQKMKALPLQGSSLAGHHRACGCIPLHPHQHQDHHHHHRHHHRHI